MTVPCVVRKTSASLGQHVHLILKLLPDGVFFSKLHVCGFGVYNFTIIMQSVNANVYLAHGKLNFVAFIFSFI